MTKLFIVEGLPCSGKSTTAKFISERLSETGKKVSYYDEGSGSHPADFEFQAYVSEKDLMNLDNKLREKITNSCTPENGGYIAELSEFTGSEFDELLRYKIYDFLPWETEMPLMLGRWQAFVDKCLADDNIYVFNCVFLQNPMCETMMRYNFPEEISFGYISEIHNIIAPLEPAVIYLKNDDTAHMVKKTALEREGWLDGVIDYHVNGGYGKSIGAKGFDGYIACLEERQRRELTVLDKLPVKKLVIENAHRDWKSAYERISEFLER